MACTLYICMWHTVRKHAITTPVDGWGSDSDCQECRRVAGWWLG